MSESDAAASGREFHFRTWPFYWLARANGRYERNMEIALKAIALDIPRWRVLMSLHEEPAASVSELAAHAIAKLPTMARIVQRMQADGLVTCEPRKSDGRVTEVRLTPKGTVAGGQAWRIAGEVYEQAFRTLKPGEINTLNRLLGKVADNLAISEPAEPRPERRGRGSDRRS